ncbi:MAG: membrane protein insertase YidC [Microbacteriaceae bacterium]|nr:membrane protein insertase YidC [Microbacteriaceae bacterium]
MENILWPIRWLVEAIMAVWHALFTGIGLESNSGLTWVLSIIGLVVVVRLLILPLTVRQIRSSRKMMELSPLVKKIQQKYKGKKDQYSRQQMQREMMALYKEHKTNPLASCFPILAQLPVFFSLFFVLRDASAKVTGVGFMDADLTASFHDAEFLGAPLKMTFFESLANDKPVVAVMLGIIMILMVASQFFTQLQLMSKNVSDETKASSMYKQQKVILYIIPFAFLFSGLTFALALNLYWLATNLWTVGQQAVVINKAPNPGSEAYRLRQERLRAKGKPTDDDIKREKLIAEGRMPAEPQQGQRVQPMSAKRAKKKGNR